MVYSLENGMPESQQARAFLAATPQMAGMSEALRAAVLERCVLQRYAGGESIFNLGDPPGGIYGLVEGAVAVILGQAEREPFFAHFGQPGFWFGEGSALNDQRRHVSIVATRATAVLHLPLPSIRVLAAADPAVWRWIGCLALYHLNVTMGAIVDLMIRDPGERVIAVLLRLADRRAPGGADLAVAIDASQQDLAAMANLSRNTLGAVLRRLQAEGLVQIGYGHITLPSPDAPRARLRT